MKRSAKVVLPIYCVMLLLLPVSDRLKAEMFMNTAAGAGRDGFTMSQASQNTGVAEFKEYNFYYDGTKWVPGWFQCDTAREVAIFREGGYESFPKRQPSQKTFLSLKQAEEPDCGMMKCYYTFAAQDKAVVVRESHYKDDEAFWTVQYAMSISPKTESNPKEQDCRWFERTRLAVITDRRSIYVTESEKGKLEYQSYNYEQSSDRPAVMLKGGAHTFDKSKGIETFTFQKAEYTYVLNVSAIESQPFVEVLVKKNGALVQQERCLSYTYLKKS
jgi:hypothetical protein